MNDLSESPAPGATGNGADGHSQRNGSENNEPSNATQVVRAEIGSTIKLYIAGKSTGITLRTDPAWPAMWRIHNGDRVSDMVNLARAKDAAIVWARPRGLGGSEVVRWDRRERALAAPLVRQIEAAATDTWTDWPPCAEAVS